MTAAAAAWAAALAALAAAAAALAAASPSRGMFGGIVNPAINEATSAGFVQARKPLFSWESRRFGLSSKEDSAAILSTECKWVPCADIQHAVLGRFAVWTQLKNGP